MKHNISKTKAARSLKFSQQNNNGWRYVHGENKSFSYKGKKVINKKLNKNNFLTLKQTTIATTHSKNLELRNVFWI